MSVWSRIANVFRGDRLNREIAEEFESHLAEAVEEGRDPEEARGALGSALRQSEASHDIKVVAWLDSLRADAIFGSRQLKRNRMTSGVAILSLALAMGACISAFRLIDALLLRPLPVTEPGRLYSVSFNGFGLEGKPYTYDSCSYPMFRKFFLGISPGWMETMKIPLIGGRDFRPADANPQVAIVNQTFAKQFFGGENPIGRSFRTDKAQTQYEVVGVAGDAIYRDLREPMLPVVYVPLRTANSDGTVQSIGSGTFVVRTASANPSALAPLLRREISRARSELRVSNIRTQQEIIDAQTIRERLLAMLALFFAGVALLLAGIGLYGVLNYSVLQRHREIGIRLAIGAPRAGIVRLIIAEMLFVVTVGAAAGMGLGVVSARYLESLLFRVKAGDPVMLALPSLVIVMVVLFATLPAVSRALRIDPAEILRTE